MSLSLRPKFEVFVPIPSDEVMEILQDCLNEEQCGVHGSRFVLQYELRIPRKERHFWSPYLNLLVLDGEDGSHVRGRFGPDIGVWSMFIAIYAILGISGTVFAIIGHSQWSINQTPTGLFYSSIAFLLAVVVYAVGKIGEGMAETHIERIRRFMAESLNVEIDIDL